MDEKDEKEVVSKDTDPDDELKRKRKVDSSVSASETSLVFEQDNKKSKQKKKKKKMNEVGDSETKQFENEACLENQLKEINQKLNNVITKDDSSLKSMMKEVVREMKEELLKSVIGRIEKLECKLFEKQAENDNLKQEIKILRAELEQTKDDNQKLMKENEKGRQTIEGSLNSLEQYGRRNNIRISGITDKAQETAEESTRLVVEILNRKMPNLGLKIQDIDIAHRIGKYKKEGNRQIIVKLHSRIKKQQIMREKKSLKSDSVYISEDLTKINQEVFKSVRTKLKDVVASAWTYEGAIRYKDHNDHIQTVHYSNYQYWLNLPWP